MTRYSVQLRDQTFVKGCWFLPFARNMSKNISKNIRSKCIQKLLDHVKQSTTDARERVFYHLILEWVGMANLIFPRRNCAVGMKLCICNNYHKDFWFSSKNLHGCADVSIFSAYISKNRYSSSLAQLIASKFEPKYDTAHSDCTNMFLDGEIKSKHKNLDFPELEGIIYQNIFSFMKRIVGNISNSTKQFRFVPKSQILTPDRMNVFQCFHLRFVMEQHNYQSDVKVFKLSGCRQNVGKCWEMILFISD